MRREGAFGIVPAEIATPLVMVLTELVQNAFEHAYAAGQRGEVVVHAERSAKWLDVVISDDGTRPAAGLLPGAHRPARVCRSFGRWSIPN